MPHRRPGQVAGQDRGIGITAQPRSGRQSNMTVDRTHPWIEGIGLHGQP